MTKDWDAVKGEIEDLSWVQKKRLDEVRKIMESEHGFKASTRAYRMKLSEWGLTTRTTSHKSAKDPKAKKRKRQQHDDEDDGSDSDSTVGESRLDQNQTADSEAAPEDSTDLETVLLGRATVREASADANKDADAGAATLDGVEECVSRWHNNERGLTARSLLPPIPNEDAAAPSEATDISTTAEGNAVDGVVMSMLAAVLENDSQKLELLLMQHPNHSNLPIGQPFEAPGSRFYNHPALSSCVILQHPEQRLLDIACAIPTNPVMWVLMAHGAKGSKHPLGTDLSLHNAIKNGRIYTVQAMLAPGRSNVHGEPGTLWKPILQAVYWNQPQIVRLLIDRGASVNETSPWVDGTMKNALLHCTERRDRDFLKPAVKENCNKILKMLLNAGADIHAKPGGEGSLTVFETFLRPWQGDPHWFSTLSPEEMECLEAFIRKGADLRTPFMGFTCGAQSYGQFQHQMLWHTTPAAARLIVDHAAPNPEGNGNTLLHEIVGSCPDAKRHPSDTLRDIEVLLGRGADPNILDESLFSPLRRCIEKCPAVDIIPRLRLLLDGGADPELKHSNRLPPYVLAARTFEEPLRSQIMDFLIAKIKGRQPRVVYDDTFMWTSGYFPIPDEPTWAQVQMYSGQNGDFNANLSRMIPEDARLAFQKACFSVASINFLNTATLRAKMSHPLPPTATHKDEIYQAVAQRQACGLPVYTFDQDFVMLLLKPNMAPILPTFPTSHAHAEEPFLLPHQTPIASSAHDAPPVLASSTPFRFNPSPSVHPPKTLEPVRSQHDNDDTDFSIPETTMVRWPYAGERTRPRDIFKAKESVLRFRCEDCGTGNLLTKGELDKHVVEHEHSRWCVEEGCRRRFCAPRS
ncbi:ankyrin [Karstenula rhodostoma CBS 690.94]|uniref:Ankyrin n=1 Tax=Karstenula rhodostoma CBS 690.94 TaxID=1392251 RepID=A0A9P4PSN3_9PLEO|nr:ankyrin [Karstenula rhodostoma CBS 690.94]